jgi:glycosyltransferase involved in cell wall biosynthesis
LLDAQITSIYSALAADLLAFNSQYNLDSFLSGCRTLLRKLPDKVPPGVLYSLQEKATVLPVPYDPIFDQEGIESAVPRWPGKSRQVMGEPLRLLWVGRFEHDKGAESLLRILRQLEETDLDYELAMVGQQFRQSPPVFTDIQAAFSSRLVHCGHIESRMEYRELLRAADVVLSTALHEFQGLAVMEAVASGCLPVVPARLVYPECYPSRFCYYSHPEDPEREAKAAAALIVDMAIGISDFDAPKPDVSQYSAGRLTPLYRHKLASVAAARDSQ